MGVFKKFSQGGGFSLPFLLHLYNGNRHVYLVNSKRPFTYQGVEFKASSFTYNPQPDGESSLSIELVNEGNQIINIFEEGYDFRAEVLGCLLEDGTVQTFGQFFHHYGSASWDGKKGDMKFSRDDRFGMTYPASVFQHYNNRGNT